MWGRSRQLTGFCLAIITVALAFSWLHSTAAHAQQSVSVGVGVGDTILSISGLSSPNAFITLHKDTGLIGTFNADASGRFTHQVVAQQSGINRLHISARDTAQRLTDTVSLEVNLQEHLQTEVYVFLPPTLDLDIASLQGNQPLVVRGQTIPGGQVSLYIDGQAAALLTAGPDGVWQHTLPTTNLSSGSHGVFARVVDGKGSQSYPTRAYSFIISRPLPLPQPTPSRPLLPDIFRPNPATAELLVPTPGQTVRQGRLVVSGLGPARTQIEVYAGQQLLGTVWSDQRGNWSLPFTFTPGSHTLRVRACQDGRCSNFSPGVTFTYKGTDNNRPRLRARLDKYSFSTAPNGRLRINLAITEGSPPFQVVVDWGDARTDRSVHDKAGIVLLHTYTKTGRYTGKILIRNPLGSQEIFFTVDVVSNPIRSFVPGLPAWLYLAVIALCLAIFLIIRKRLQKFRQSPPDKNGKMR
ncbi:MAG TPA: hypothetical protein VK978_02850 [Candidatus Saccharimonadales bacterium]|nr:hypothetical protein [Candidatus Saccharimonadales bacterium]